MAKIFILLGSDDYVSRQILDVYATRERAEQDIVEKKHLLISRQSEPKREIVEKDVIE